MNTAGQHTRDEVFSQPDAWTAALQVIRAQQEELRDLVRLGQFSSVIYTGCGSTYYLSLAAAALFQELTGIPARGVPASEVWLYPRSAFSGQRRLLLIAVSRSGETTETVRACETFRAQGQGEVLTLSCHPGKPLTQLGTTNLVFPSGREKSIAQTRAFSTLYLAATALAALWAGRDDLIDQMDRLPAIGHRLLQTYRQQTAELGQDAGLDRFYYLGSGPRYGLACELSLKMKEMSLSISEPFHFLEFRHGPQSMVTANTLIFGLVSESNRAYEMGVLAEMHNRGARLLCLGERRIDIAFDSGLAEAARNVLYLPVGQMLAFERALAHGLNPDRPHNLTAVVKLPSRP